MIRVAYLGPAGTFTEEAMHAAAGDAELEAAPQPTVYEAIRSVSDGDADRAFVPFENSIEGAVRATLDTLAFDATTVTIAGEHDHAISQALIAGRELELGEIEAVFSYPQASAQCTRFIRERLPRAETRAADSTADAVRMVSESDKPWAAIGAASAAELYGAVVLRQGVQDEPDNTTRFVWIAPEGTEPQGDGPWRTTLIFSELGEDHPGALVDALTEFSSRDVNLTRIESRPRRMELGRYMFFIDLEGATSQPVVNEAIDGLRTKAEQVRILGSYPVNAPGIP